MSDIQWNWDLYPLASESWGNRHSTIDTMRPDRTFRAVRFMMPAGGGRTIVERQRYVPTPADVKAVGENPDWLGIHMALIRAGHSQAELERTPAPVAVAMAARAAKRPQSKRRPQGRKPTPAQLEAMMVVGECQQNFAEAARRLKKDPKTVRQLYSAGLKNAGKLAGKLIGKPKMVAVPHDRRGQLDVAENDDCRR